MEDVQEWSGEMSEADSNDIDPELLKEIEGDLGKGITKEQYPRLAPRIKVDAYSIARALDGVPCSGGYKCRCPVIGHGKGEGD